MNIIRKVAWSFGMSQQVSLQQKFRTRCQAFINAATITDEFSGRSDRLAREEFIARLQSAITGASHGLDLTHLNIEVLCNHEALFLIAWAAEQFTLADIAVALPADISARLKISRSLSAALARGGADNDVWKSLPTEFVGILQMAELEGSAEMENVPSPEESAEIDYVNADTSSHSGVSEFGDFIDFEARTHSQWTVKELADVTRVFERFCADMNVTGIQQLFWKYADHDLSLVELAMIDGAEGQQRGDFLRHILERMPANALLQLLTEFALEQRLADTPPPFVRNIPEFEVAELKRQLLHSKLAQLPESRAALFQDPSAHLMKVIECGVLDHYLDYGETYSPMQFFRRIQDTCGPDAAPLLGAFLMESNPTVTFELVSFGFLSKFSRRWEAGPNSAPSRSFAIVKSDFDRIKAEINEILAEETDDNLRKAAFLGLGYYLTDPRCVLNMSDLLKFLRSFDRPLLIPIAQGIADSVCGDLPTASPSARIGIVSRLRDLNQQFETFGFKAICEPLKTELEKVRLSELMHRINSLKELNGQIWEKQPGHVKSQVKEDLQAARRLAEKLRDDIALQNVKEITNLLLPSRWARF